VTATGLAVLALARGSDDVFPVGVRVAILGLLALVAALVLAQAWLVATSLLLLGGVYAMHLAVDDAPLDLAVVLVAAGVLVTAELAYWSLEERQRVKSEPGEGLHRLTFVGFLGVAATVVAVVLLGLVDIVQARGLAVDLLGAMAAAAVLLAVVLAAGGGRTRSRP
jgi:hypothetical protein